MLKLQDTLVLKLGHEAFDGIVGALAAVSINQVLVYGGGVAAQAQLGVNEGAGEFAPGGCHWRSNRQRSRWPGWSSLTGWVGGRPGAVGQISSKTLLVKPNGVARNAGDALNLALAGTALEQCPDGGLQMWFQDVHSFGSLVHEGVESNVLPVGPRGARRTGFQASNHRGQGGAVWVAISEAVGYPSGDPILKAV